MLLGAALSPVVGANIIECNNNDSPVELAMNRRLQLRLHRSVERQLDEREGEII